MYIFTHLKIHICLHYKPFCLITVCRVATLAGTKIDKWYIWKVPGETEMEVALADRDGGNGNRAESIN